MIYDDGSSLTTYDDGSTLSIGSDGSRASTPAPGFAGDKAEATRFQPHNPDQSQPWWASGAMYGFQAVIDNHFRKQPVPTGSTPVTYAGQNGRTYANGTMVQQDPLGIGSIPPILLLAGLGLLIYMTGK